MAKPRMWGRWWPTSEGISAEAPPIASAGHGDGDEQQPGAQRQQPGQPGDGQQQHRHPGRELGAEPRAEPLAERRADAP